MKKLILLLLIASGCMSQRYLPAERFYYQESDIYHISSYGDTTLLNQADIRALKIDSLKWEN